MRNLNYCTFFNQVLSMPTDASAPAKKLYIKTHGCQMNEYDSARMRDLLGESHQMVATENPEEADVILIKDRKSTRLNSSHVAISYAVFCLKKKKQHSSEER